MLIKYRVVTYLERGHQDRSVTNLDYISDTSRAYVMII